MMDPTRILFAQLERKLLDDDDNRGLNCHGCLFHRQPARVCHVAGIEAVKRGLRDCDSLDQFGEVVIYVATAVDPRQMDLIGEQN
ncbi:hypothetical protein [Massilia sp. METH4]|uniref:hypothetical protein n=1 Tax=Massilia sp. METH4 TaxID=3123041 RepID=UPI0030D3100B